MIVYFVKEKHDQGESGLDVELPLTLLISLFACLLDFCRDHFSVNAYLYWSLHIGHS